MSGKVFSRDYALGKVKKLQRMKQQLAIHITATPPRNPVVLAMAHRAVSSAAGKHVRAQGAMRRAEKVSLQKLVRQLGQ